MALVDLQSDLSKFRSEVSREPKSTPEASKATSNKNFATFQPITEKLKSMQQQIARPDQTPIEDKLSSRRTQVEKFNTTPVETKLNSTRLDDIIKVAMEDMTLNSVSRLSNINKEFSLRNVNALSLDKVQSRFDDIRQEVFVSRLDKSNIIVTKTNVGTNNLNSPIDVVRVENDTTNNIVIPEIEITRPEQQIERGAQSPNLSPARTVIGGTEIRTESGNVTNPNIPITRPEQSTDRSGQSVVINKDLFSPLNNVIDPNLALQKSELLILVPEAQTPNIITETIKQGLVVDPNTKVFRVQNGEFHLAGDESFLNRDEKPVRFVTTSRLANIEPTQEPDTERYDLESVQTTDRSSLNVDTVIKTIPGGRHENTEGTSLAIVGTQQVNFFPDTNARGFVVRAQQGSTEYTGDSVFGWSGNSTAAPTTNFITDTNGVGFKKFASVGETDYNTESSKFGFSRPTGVDYFDVTKQYASDGFKTFVIQYETAYKQDASEFVWKGKSGQAPEVDYFDVTGQNSNGFHRFAQIYDSRYIPDSSIYDFDGVGQSAPAVNYFDVTGQYTNAGFQTFPQLYDTKYVSDASAFTWGGDRQSSPEVNYFDLNGTNTTIGFHRFAQLYDSKFVHESSTYDWDGNNQNAPEVNYFDVSATHTTTGFHRFPQSLDSKYVPDSSLFTFKGNPTESPEVNYFDLNGRNTTSGFHRFAQALDTKYVSDSSVFTFAGDKNNSPEVNYFDLNGTNTTTGFHRFAQQYDTKYIHQSSRFDWDGNKQEAPEVNYFDLNGQSTSTGFHRFAQLYDSKYIPNSSIYDWDGNKQSAPEVDQFDLIRSSTTKGFEKIAPSMVTRYVRDASRFVFDGSAQSAPETDYVDLTKKFATKGFEKFPQRMVTKYVKDGSEFTFKGANRSAPKTNFFTDTQGKGFTTFAQKLSSEYVKDISEYTFKGGLPTEINFFADTNGSGFVNKTPLLETKYVKDSSTFTFQGSTPTPVDFLGNTNGSGFDLKVALNETKYVEDSSQFTFKGDPKSANTANFFNDLSATGFTSFPQSLTSEYVGESLFGIPGNAKVNEDLKNGGVDITSKVESKLAQRDSTFGWTGTRQEAPEVNYLGITAENPESVEGFTRLFSTTETKLSQQFSRFSFAGSSNLAIPKNVPFTTFFGYTPSERTGFMVGMTGGESTLYPIIDPVLRFDEDSSRRFDIESARAQRRSIKTINQEKYAPLSLGKRPWSNGTLSATLENQVPDIVTGGIAGSYENKYERGVKDNTEQRGYLTKWAITRRSPSPLDAQYSKFNLRDDSFNYDFVWNQPFVLRGIQGGLEPERWGGIFRGVDDGVARAGIATMVDRVIFDSQRIGKFLTSIKGLAWNVRQVGLQFMNPVVDINPSNELSQIAGVSTTLTFNPLSVIANVATARVGFHIPRHGISTLDLLDSGRLNMYEKATVARELQLTAQGTAEGQFSQLEKPTTDNKTNYNRLIGLMKELLPNSFTPSITPSQTPTPTDQEGQQPTPPPSIPQDISGNSEIVRISSNFGGPSSFLGIGGTRIHRSTHPYLVHYTTAPDLRAQREPTYTPESRRDTFYAYSTTYGSYLKENGVGGLLKALSYLLPGGPKELNDVSQEAGSPNIQQEQNNIISGVNPYSPRHDTQFSRTERRTSINLGKTETLLANSVHPDNVDKDSLIKQYRTANYDKLRRNNRLNNKYFNDFRADVGVDFASGSQADDQGRAFVTNPNIARFGTRNLSERYGFGDQGRPGVRRDQPFISSVRYAKFDNPEIIQQNGNKEFRDYGVPIQKEGQYFRGDRINIIDYKRANFNINTGLAYELGNTTLAESGVNGTRDLIEFYFSSLVLQGHDNCPAEIIVFRATFGSITDNHKPSWNSVKYMGRADPLYVYQGYEREVSFDFTVHIGSRDEMRASWRKLNYLASWTAPEYRDNGFMRGPMVRLNIGHLYRKMPGYISSLSYTFDNQQTTWETAKLPEDMNLNDATIKALSSPGVLQLPKHIDVSVSFVPVGVYRPEFRGVMYSLYDDTTTGTNVETGLIPHNSPNRVNYFVEYEDKGTPVIYTGYDNGKPYAAKPIQTITVSPDPSDPEPDPQKSNGTQTSGSATEKPNAATPTSNFVNPSALPKTQATALEQMMSGSYTPIPGVPIVRANTARENLTGVALLQAGQNGSTSSTTSKTPPANTDKKDGKTDSPIPRPKDGVIPPSPLPTGLTTWVAISSEENKAYDALWSSKKPKDATFRTHLEALRKAALEGYEGIPAGKAAAVYYMRKTFNLKKNQTANVPGY
jgi:hypothetical protein